MAVGWTRPILRRAFWQREVELRDAVSVLREVTLRGTVPVWREVELRATGGGVALRSFLHHEAELRRTNLSQAIPLTPAAEAIAPDFFPPG